MKICHITMFYYPIIGGQEVYIQNLIDVCDKANYKSHILQSDNYIQEKPPIVSLSPQFRKPIESKDILFNIQKKIYVLYYYTLKLFLKRNPYFRWFKFNLDLCFSNNFLKKYDLLIVHYPFHYPSVKKHKKVIVISHCVLWDLPISNYFDKYHIKASKQINTEKTVIVSNDTEFLRQIGYNILPKENRFKEISRNVWFIPNCVDVEFYKKLPELKKEPIFIVPRHIRRDKGIHFAIQAYAAYYKKYETKYSLHIYGKVGDLIYFDYCKQLIADYGIESKVIFNDSITWEKMPLHYNIATLTIIPSVGKEGTSLSALESMSCGTPCVSTNIAGLKDLPCLQSELNPEDMADKINQVMQNYNSVAEEQYKEVRNTYNLQNWSQTWLEVISKTSK
jgi:glycosyltransferase involved in cell wall biosynthesis